MDLFSIVFFYNRVNFNQSQIAVVNINSYHFVAQPYIW